MHVQVFDVSVDRINKPHLPLASGEWSMELGITVAASTGGAALLAGWLSGSWPLMATLAGSLALGIAYSTDLPFLRWKRYPLLAAGCILSVRYCLQDLQTSSSLQSSTIDFLQSFACSPLTF